MADALISHSNLSVCCDIVFIMLPKLLVFVLVNVQTFFFSLWFFSAWPKLAWNTFIKHLLLHAELSLCQCKSHKLGAQIY